MIGQLLRRRLSRILRICSSILCCGQTSRHRKRATRVMQQPITLPGCYSMMRCKMIHPHIRPQNCWRNLRQGCPSIQRDKKGVKNYGRKFGYRNRDYRVLENSMKWSFGAKSIVFFLLAVLFLILITLFESALASLSLRAERLLSLYLLVLPAVVGVVFGILSLVRKEPRPWLGILGTLLNTLFALFHIFLLSFAG